MVSDSDEINRLEVNVEDKGAEEEDGGILMVAAPPVNTWMLSAT